MMGFLIKILLLYLTSVIKSPYINIQTLNNWVLGADQSALDYWEDQNSNGKSTIRGPKKIRCCPKGIRVKSGGSGGIFLPRPKIFSWLGKKPN